MTDSMIMLRRNFKHTARNPAAVITAIIFPVILMLMFVCVFGGAFKVSGNYVDYATPGLIMVAVCYGLSAAATSVNADMTKGIINRLKVMDVSRGAVLTGHVVATTVRLLIAVTSVVLVALVIGFRPSASFLDWLGVVGVIVLVGFAVSWLTVALGLMAKTAESSAMAAVPLIILPFVSTTFVPADTMMAGVRQFAEYQPFTPIIETLRGLLAGTPSAGTAVAAVAWCIGIGLVGYFWSLSTFTKQI